MKITNIDILTDDIEVVSFPLSRANSKSRFIAKNVIGLDADEVVPKFYGFGSVSNSKFYRMIPKKRVIVFRIEMRPRWNINESYSDVRDDLYRLISPTRTGEIELLFRSAGSVLANIKGRITKVEAPYFSSKPEVQITVECTDYSLFRGINPIAYSLGDLSSTNPMVFADKMSTAPHGLTFEVTFTASTTEFVIQDVETNPDWKFRIVRNFVSGEKLFFSNEYGKKQLYVDTSGTILNLLSLVEPGSTWPIIFPGANSFHFNQRSSFNFTKVEYYPVYWGL